MNASTRSRKNKAPSANALKQKRFRERQKALGKKMVRGYVTPQAMRCYDEITEVTNWSDSDVISNALKITYAAYKCGQIGLLTKWLKDHQPDETEEADNNSSEIPKV